MGSGRAVVFIQGHRGRGVCDTHRREQTLCFEKRGPLLRTIRTSSSLTVWISGSQISLSDQHTISVECRASMKYGSHGPVQKR